MRVNASQAIPLVMFDTVDEPLASFTAILFGGCYVNRLRPMQNGRHFADDTFKRILLNENVIISIKISLKFVPRGRINDV